MATASRSRKKKTTDIDPADMPVLFQPERQAAKPKVNRFRVHSPYEPAGDQPTAIAELVRGVEGGERDQG
ncbi:hypothetical protein, partial [Komagataeibacter rhaeticus]|uniref:hypothetical protein n=1 Tax=Komagataeibacter rhaeticus TaxID=215221 RepID=UPI0039E9C2AB